MNALEASRQDPVEGATVVKAWLNPTGGPVFAAIEHGSNPDITYADYIKLTALIVAHIAMAFCKQDGPTQPDDVIDDMTKRIAEVAKFQISVATMVTRSNA